MIDGQAPVEIFDELDSTILEARRRAERGDTGPVWLIARKQTAGRGRRGRAWISFEGNLFATYLFATTRPVSEIPLLGFATGIALAEAMDAFGVAAPVTLKWPNDVMINRGKVAGILLDSGALAHGGTWAALAFGVNVAVAPKAIDQAATSLRAELPANTPVPSAMEFFTSLRPRLEIWAARLASEGFEPIRQTWMSRAHAVGEIARVRHGAEMLEGRILGLSPRGELELETSAGLRVIAAGEIILSNAA
jgi:BirA family biotin operon repressor/biotin-[acetyl-CoA-carboxylase] ligase